MKKILFVLALFIALSYADGECAVIKCGNIKKDGDTHFCAQRIDGTEGNPTSLRAMKCPSGQFCQAGAWPDPMSAMAYYDTLVCGDLSPNGFPQEFTPVAGVGLDGDYCISVADCFTSTENAAICQTNVCRASTMSGSACAGDSRNCPIGHFCSNDNVCAPLLKRGEFCSEDSQCERNHDCIKTEKDNNFVCTAYGSLKNGDLFQRSPSHNDVTPMGFLKEARQNGNSVGEVPVYVSNVCKTTGEVTVAYYQQCRYHMRNKDQTYMKKNIMENCVVFGFSDENPDNYNQPIFDETVPLCGFNKNSKPICPLFLGDDYIQKLLSKLQGLFSKMNCHRLSGVTNFGGGSVCNDFYKIGDTKGAFNLFRLSQVLDSQTWANTANNARCVAKTVTYRNWFGFEKYFLEEGEEENQESQ
ncbi:unnamed protein product [Moneuplotes crassus]|uniref:Uncharacterized protein n=1 Tax=Euplotes crassus TaxID=5936 RepID=A0AAD1XE88_EUPCR|nr:unnamed protein product [Moneuplotes crassus]